MLENTNHLKPLEPEHVAIIMDGNGRWAAQRGLSRSKGHRAGVDAMRRTIEAAVEVGISYLTLYGFSSENWKRPEKEVNDLMMLLKRFVRRDLAELHEANVRVRVIGGRTGLDPEITRLLHESEELTANNSGLNLVVAFNYGGRGEIARAMGRIAEKIVAGELEPQEISEQTISAHLDTAGAPDPDLIIRTSGEKRLSNFLIWQCAYAEFFFTDVYWPDFSARHLQLALEDYRNRDRRFGGLATREAV